MWLKLALVFNAVVFGCCEIPGFSSMFRSLSHPFSSSRESRCKSLIKIRRTRKFTRGDANMEEVNRINGRVNSIWLIRWKMIKFVWNPNGCWLNHLESHEIYEHLGTVSELCGEKWLQNKRNFRQDCHGKAITKEFWSVVECNCFEAFLPRSIRTNGFRNQQKRILCK